MTHHGTVKDQDHPRDGKTTSLMNWIELETTRLKSIKRTHSWCQ